MHKDLNIVSPFVAAVIATIAAFTMVLLYDEPNGTLIINFDYSAVKPILGNIQTVLNGLFILVFIIVMNFTLVGVLYDRERIMGYIISYFTAVISFIGFIAVSIILSMN